MEYPSVSSSRRETYLLGEEHVEMLEDLIYHVRKNSNYKLNKSQIVRALIISMQKRNIDFSNIASEEDLAEQLSQ